MEDIVVDAKQSGLVNVAASLEYMPTLLEETDIEDGEDGEKEKASPPRVNKVEVKTKEMIDLEYLVSNGARYNFEWVRRNQSHYLAGYANTSKVFTETCCEVTVEMLKEQLTRDHAGMHLDGASENVCAAAHATTWEAYKMPATVHEFKEIMRKHPVIQLDLYNVDDTEYISVQHTLIIYLGRVVLQSFYRKHSLRMTPITDSFLSAILKPSQSADDLAVVDPLAYGDTIDRNLLNDTFTIMYWVPSVTSYLAPKKMAAVTSVVGPSTTIVDAKNAIPVELHITTAMLTPTPDDAKTIRAERLAIGNGTFSDVYKLKLHGCTVAVKKLREEIITTQKPSDLLKAEVRMLKRVACANVISVYGVTGLVNITEPKCIVMEYACYGTLAAVLQRPMPVSWRLRMHMLIGVALGMTRLHGSNPVVIHMDLKPANVLICRGYRAKLADFGCSKLSEFTRAHAHRQGSAAFMCPESRGTKASPEPSWDMYAFGVVMYQVLTRLDPWSGLRSESELDRELVAGRRPKEPPSCEESAGAPAGYRECMNRCWATNPKERPTFRTIVDELRRMKRSLQGSRNTTTTTTIATATTVTAVSPVHDSESNDSKESQIRELQTNVSQLETKLSLLTDETEKKIKAAVRVTRLQIEKTWLEQMAQTKNGSDGSNGDAVARPLPTTTVSAGSASTSSPPVELLQRANELVADQKSEIEALKAQLSAIERSSDRAALSQTERVMFEDKIRRDNALINQMRRELEFVRKQRDDAKSSASSSQILAPLAFATPLHVIPPSGIGAVTAPSRLRTSGQIDPSPGLMSLVDAAAASTALIPGDDGNSRVSDSGSAVATIVTTISSSPSPWMANGLRNTPESKWHSAATSSTPSAPSSDMVALSSPPSSRPASSVTITVPVPTTSSGGGVSMSGAGPNGTTFGYCSACEKAAPVRVSRRCNKCHSEDLVDTRDTSNWTELNGEYNGCMHNAGAKCENKRWEFVATCHIHPQKTPDRHCPLLPGVIANVEGKICGGCNAVHPIILRFGCGHFVCLPKCWRNYARVKLDNRELLFNTRMQGSDATLSCPAGCRYYVESHHLFKSLGKARFEQYQTLGMEHLVGRALTPESKEGRLSLVTRITTPTPSKKCPLCGNEHRRVSPSGQPTLNNRIQCIVAKCGQTWCWQCGTAWTPECRRDHLISVY